MPDTRDVAIEGPGTNGSGANAAEVVDHMSLRHEASASFRDDNIRVGSWRCFGQRPRRPQKCRANKD
eukprot:9137151-Pyramimonas_sp.AAC.1